MIKPWLERTLNAVNRAERELELVFVGDEYDPTFYEVDQFSKACHVPAYLVTIEEPRSYDKRDWNHDRYGRMVELRNTLLDVVRKIGPELFLSLDSDILLHPDSIRSMIECLDRFDAVGGKTYMTPAGRRCPSYANLSAMGHLRRPDSEGVLSVGVIMAIKLMTQPAYNIDYEFDVHGEDIGWSKAARKAGLTLGWDGRIVNKHIMKPDMLDKFDQRAGF
jgi:hypothetical protein